MLLFWISELNKLRLLRLHLQKFPRLPTEKLSELNSCRLVSFFPLRAITKAKYAHLLHFFLKNQPYSIPFLKKIQFCDTFKTLILIFAPGMPSDVLLTFHNQSLALFFSNLRSDSS